MTFLLTYFLLSGIFTALYALMLSGNMFFVGVSVIFLSIAALLFALKRRPVTTKNRRLHTFLIRCSTCLGILNTVAILLIALAGELLTEATVFHRVTIGFLFALPVILSAVIAGTLSYFASSEKGTMSVLEASLTVNTRPIKNGKKAFYPYGIYGAGYLLNSKEADSIQALYRAYYRNIFILIIPLYFIATRSLLISYILLIAVLTYYFWKHAILLKGKPRVENTDTRQDVQKKFALAVGKKRVIGFILMAITLVPLMGWFTWLFFQVPDRDFMAISGSVFFALLTIFLMWGAYTFIRLLRFFHR